MDKVVENNYLALGLWFTLNCLFYMWRGLKFEEVWAVGYYDDVLMN